MGWSRKFYNKLMQEWLDKNYIFMYSTYNECKSVIAERLIKTLKAKIYKKITANDSKSYLSYLKKLVDQYNNNADYSDLTENAETKLQLLSLK